MRTFAMPPDTSRTIEIEGSALRFILPAFFGFALGIGALLIALPIPTDLHDNTTVRIVFSLLAAFFLAGAAYALSGLKRPHAALVTVSPQGFCDRRISPDTVPWSAVTDVSEWSFGSQDLMIVRLDPAVERSLKLTPMARWTRVPNRWFGADGFCVAPLGFAYGTAELTEIFTAYALAHGGSA